MHRGEYERSRDYGPRRDYDRPDRREMDRWGGTGGCSGGACVPWGDGRRSRPLPNLPGASQAGLRQTRPA